MIQLLGDILARWSRVREQREEPQPTSIPIWVTRELDTLLDGIDRSSDPQEIQSLIKSFRLRTDPVTNHYPIDQSNRQICLLNERLAKIGYSGLQVPEYQHA